MWGYHNVDVKVTHIGIIGMVWAIGDRPVRTSRFVCKTRFVETCIHKGITQATLQFNCVKITQSIPTFRFD